MNLWWVNVWSAQAGELQTSFFSLSKQALIFSEGWSPHQNLIWKWNLIALLSGSTVPISLWGTISVYISLLHYPSAGGNRCSDLVPPSLTYPTPSLFRLSNHTLVWFYAANTLFYCFHHVAKAGPTLLQQIYPIATPLLTLTPSQSHQQDFCVHLCLKGHLSYQSCSFQGDRHTDWTLFLTVYVTCR